MTTIRKWSGDGLGAGSLTTASTGPGDNAFDVVNGSPTIVASGARSPSVQVSGVNTTARWLITPQTTGAGRCYFTTPASWPSASAPIAGTVDGAAMSINLAIGGSGSPGQLRLRDGTSVLQQTSTGTLSLSTRYRFEWTVNHTSGASVAKCYLGDSLSEVASLSGATVSASSHGEVFWGQPDAAPSLPTSLYDDLAVGDTATLVGPISAALDATPADSLGIADATASALSAARAVGDPAGLADVASATSSAARTAVDSAGGTDAVSAILSSVRAIADSASITDTPGPQVLDVALGVDDPAGIADAVARVIAAARTVVDQVGVTDAASAVILTGSTIGDQVAGVDSATTVIDAGRASSDALAATDTASATSGFDRPLADSATVTDSVSIVIAMATSVDDQLAVTDSVSASVTSAGAAGVSDPVAGGDAVTISLGGVRTLADAAGLLDAVSAVLIAQASASDPLGGTDQASTTVGLARPADDLGALADAVGTVSVAVRAAADDAGITDVITAVLAATTAPPWRTLQVYYERRYRPGWTDTFDHDPQARLDYTWDWSDVLDGDTIASATVTARVPAERDPADGVSVEDVWPGDTSVTAWIAGGTHGTPCAITCHITTTAGRQDDRTIWLRVRDR